MVIWCLGNSQGKPEAFIWLDSATTRGKDVCVTKLYPLIAPTLPKYYTPPCNWLTVSGHRLLEIGFRLTDDQQWTRSALLRLTVTYIHPAWHYIVTQPRDTSCLPALGQELATSPKKEGYTLRLSRAIFPVRVIKPDGKSLLIVKSSIIIVGDETSWSLFRLFYNTW